MNRQMWNPDEWGASALACQLQERRVELLRLERQAAEWPPEKLNPGAMDVLDGLLGTFALQVVTWGQTFGKQKVFRTLQHH